MNAPEHGRHTVWRGSTRLGIALLVLCVPAACGVVRTRLATRGVLPASRPLRVGTSGDYAPFSLRAADDSLTGFDIEVARAYAAERGREIVFVSFRWPELGARFGAGDFDIVMSGVTVRPDPSALSTG